MTKPSEITRMLEGLRGREAAEQVLPAVYEQLKAIARRELSRERPDHTLGATALVHETYLKLAKLDRLEWQSRSHFFGACAGAMRRILVNHAERRGTQKRGGGAAHVALEDAVVTAATRPAELLALDAALERLEAVDPRLSKIVEFRYFAGMTIEETAEALGVSPATVKRDWALARAWLNRELAEPEADSPSP